MKPSQTAMLNDLRECHMLRTEWLALDTIMNWRGVHLSRSETNFLRHLWNKYQMQIRAIKKNGAKK